MILVVDHDPEVLERAREILNRDRQVFLASSAEKAFDMVTRQLGFSVVLVDLDLPGDPYALMRRLHKTHPDLMIIAVGGGAKTPAPELTKHLGVVEVINKPITPEWKPLVERIRARRFGG